MIAAGLPRVNTEVKHRAEYERKTSGDIVWRFFDQTLVCIKFKEFASLTNAKQRYQKQVFIVQVIEIADV